MFYRHYFRVIGPIWNRALDLRVVTKYKDRMK